MKVEEIAGLLGARFEGDGTLEITAGNDLSMAGVSELAFAEGDQADSGGRRIAGGMPAGKRGDD